LIPKNRRYVILAEGYFASRYAKTAHGIIRYGQDEVVAVIDSTLAGRRVLKLLPDLRHDAPIVSTLQEALTYSPTSILVGIATPGGWLPQSWIPALREAAAKDLEIVNGLHQRLAPEFPETRVWDVRKPPTYIPEFSGAGLSVAPRVALTVGTHSDIGKMTTTLEIARSAREAGVLAEIVATGQTGMIVAQRGICIDAVPMASVAGACEHLVLEAARREPELILVEGQGSVADPAYSGVTAALLHGSCPDCLILCAGAFQNEVFGYSSPGLQKIGALYEDLAALVKRAPVVAVSVNTWALDELTSERLTDNVNAITGLPTVDPVRSGARPLLEAIRRV
jgi:uncharacterized NAD-dependent epimerase/dehydratase family protein